MAAAAQKQKPTIVIVPASFSPPYFYDTFVSQLRAHDYHVAVVSLPSVGGETATNMTDDATAIQAVTTKLADEGKDIVLVTHSYGGIPGTESAYGLAQKEREASGKKGGIVALLYVAALLVKPGMSLGTTMGEGAGVPDYVKVDGDFMTLEAEGNSKVTFSDLPIDEAVAWAAKMPHHSTLSFGGELTHPMYKDIPTTYLFTKEDKTVPPEMQRSMVDAANELGASPITEYSIHSGHVPFISVPDQVVEVVRKVAGEEL